MTATPFFSIIIPVRNAGQYLSEAVESILRQPECNDCEILVIDDHSDDIETQTVLRGLAARSDTIRVLNNTGARGASPTRNVGLAAASADWVAFLDADDVWTPGSLKHRMTLVDAHPDVDWHAGHYLFWDPDGTFSPGISARADCLQPAFASGRPIRVQRPVETFIGETIIHLGGVVARKSAVHDVGGFNEKLWIRNDWYFYLCMATRSDLVFSPVVFMHHRREGAGRLTTSPATRTALYCRASILAFFDPRFSKHRRRLRWRIVSDYRTLSRTNASLGNKWRSRRLAAAGLLWAPEDRRNWQQIMATFFGP